MIGNYGIIQSIINPDEEFIWSVTGSIRDIKFNPLYWILIVVTLGLFIPVLYYKRVYRTFVLTNQRLIIITGIFSKFVDEIELFRIVDTKTNQSLIDIWSNIGDIIVNSTDKTGTIVMPKIANPHYVRDSLRQFYTMARQKKGTVVLESLGT
ncbi:MAG: PH domain-containing protein [Lactobacillales bacterium]|jgi:uncharacterized membrane protein YdbT with pleckstrin-like domain|nr:PH domain-containing protein [Lactobacillales bacterium]